MPPCHAKMSFSCRSRRTDSLPECVCRHHANCLLSKPKTKIESVDDVKGFHELKFEDQQLIKNAISGKVRRRHRRAGPCHPGAVGPDGAPLPAAYVLQAKPEMPAAAKKAAAKASSDGAEGEARPSSSAAAAARPPARRTRRACAERARRGGRSSASWPSRTAPSARRARSRLSRSDPARGDATPPGKGGWAGGD